MPCHVDHANHLDQPDANSNARPVRAAPLAPAVSLEVDETLAGQRLDRVLAARVQGLSRTRAQAAIEAGRVTVDGKSAKASLLLEPGMRVTLAPAESAAAPSGVAEPAGQTAATVAPAPAPPLRVVYED